MIPKAQYTRAVTRFEIAIKRLRLARQIHTYDKRGALFEYRDSKRSLLELGYMLISGEAPKVQQPKQPIRHPASEHFGEPKTGIGVR